MELIQLDLDKILRNRMSKRVSRLVPRVATRCLERIICQDGLNEILRVTYPAEGSEFARKVLQHLNITLDVTGRERIDPDARYIFASNHPLGALDGIAVIAMMGDIYPDERICFLVNDLLMNVVPLRPVFLPINKYGSQGRAAAKSISEAYDSADKQILIFPAGLVSRKQKRGVVQDLEWKKAFVQKSIQSGRDIVPMRFVALNSNRFYNTARWRTRLHIPVNLEQALLPSEVFKARNSNFEIRIGTPIPVSEVEEMVKQNGLNATAARIRDIVYSL